MPVVGLEDWYEVSDRGQVRSLARIIDRPHSGPFLSTPKILSQFINKRPEYRRVSLRRRDGGFRKVMVHVLMLEAFVGPRPPEMEACHRDDDPANNTIENLRWDTRRENTLDRVRNGTHPSARKTKCIAGHELSGSNLYESPRGSRECKTCRRAATHRHREAKREK